MFNKTKHCGTKIYFNNYYIILLVIILKVSKTFIRFDYTYKKHDMFVYIHVEYQRNVCNTKIRKFVNYINYILPIK